MKLQAAVVLCFCLSLSQAQNVWTIYNKSNSDLVGDEIHCMAKDQNGNIWIGTDYGISIFDGAAFTTIDSSNSGLPVNQIRSIAFDKAGNAWVGTLQAGYSVLSAGTWTTFNAQNSQLPDDFVRCITFDSAGVAWLGTSGGAVYQDSEGWLTYDIFNSPLGAGNINKILVDQKDVVWIGTVNGGMSRKDGNSWNTYNNVNSGISDNTINDIEFDSYGNIWFATPAQGLGRFNGSQWFFRNDFNSGMPTNALTSLEVNHRTDVKYMGSFDKGLIRWNNALSFDSFTTSNSPLPENYVTALVQADDSTFYIGTQYSGLVKWVDTAVYNTMLGLPKSKPNYQHLDIYPNPSHSTASFRTEMGDNIRSYKMFSPDGRIIKEQTVNFEDEIQLDVSGLISGNYHLVVQGEDFVSAAKIVVIH